ncbi:MAG: hypothetical protein B7Y25_07790 [Alphaproteobacteria bacterium 16-39-46]|nr:MAG: hypothetical protein B7Y25_07790 [Alphaproteobacteria bacterium 16-39-46]OZA41447.1 MAG: hypothetical protein B7X84_07940 [Alphaproteobacteria bacterium 17-39-52]HQS84806.1 MFS transporter [Alphaproteobacteria bacterium]HQS94599.1 MFS transporter [Alphaproteobacteria bacterium]
MKIKSITAALIGHTLERYDVALYGYFSALLAPIFFPNSDSLGILWSLGAFAAGYLMRPFGGVIFGHLGDKYGRKKAFTLSILLVVIPTLTIGILPSYNRIGLFAPFILMACRLMQGLCGGGEFSGAGIFVGKHIKAGQEGLGGGLICSTGLLGALIGTALGSVVTLSNMPTWGWRLPFILGAFMTFFSYLIRRRMHETPVFTKVMEEVTLPKLPLKNVFKYHKKNIFCGIAIGGYGHCVLYMATIYMNVLYTKNLHLSSHDSLVLNTMILALWVLISPLFGLLADKVGIKRFMSFGALVAIVSAYPLFWYMTTTASFKSHVIFQVALTLIGVSFVAPISGLFTSLFPARERYSGVAFSITLGQALLGGTTPLISTFLTTFTGDANAPAYFLIGAGILGFTATRTLKEYSKYDLTHIKNLIEEDGENKHETRNPLA